MSEVLFAYTNIDDIRDDYFLLEDHIVYEDDTCVIGCDVNRFAKDENTIVAMFGEIFNIDEFGYDIEEYTDAEIVLKLIDYEDPEEVCGKFAGSFTIFIYERDFKTWMLITDSMGVYYPFYYIEDDEFIISMNLNDFHNKFFDIDPTGIGKIIYDCDFRIKETPIDGVCKLTDGSILKWPEQTILKYIDIREELEHAYENKIDISIKEATYYIDELLRKTVKVTSRNYDCSRMAVIKNGDIDEILVESTVTACGAEPRGYSIIFPLQEQLPYITKKMATSETNKRRRITDKLNDKLGLAKDVCEVIWDYDNIEEYLLTADIKNLQWDARWSNVLFSDNEIGKQMRDDDISCAYTGKPGNIIFLNQVSHYIFYALSRDGMADDIDDISDDQIRDMYHDTIYNSSNYSFDDIKIYRKGREQIKSGFVHYIIERMNIAKGRSSDREARLTRGIPFIDLYKNHKLWAFILSLPDNILLGTSMEASLQKRIIEKQRNIKKFKWPLLKWKSWNPSEIITFDKKVDKLPQSVPLTIKPTYKILEDLDAALIMFEKNGVNTDVTWYLRSYQQKPDELTGAEMHMIFKALFVYYWLKAWLD